jgi:hypothetical protein
MLSAEHAQKKWKGKETYNLNVVDVLPVEE